MSTSLLYHAFGIRGYEYVRTDYQGGEVIFTIHQDPDDLPLLGLRLPQVISRGHVERRFRTLPIGSRPTSVVLPIPRVECQACGARAPGQGPLRRSHGGATPTPSSATPWNCRGA